MIKVLFQTLLLNLYRSFGYPKVLPINFTLLISTVCNSRCKTCNIWKQIRDDLSLDEWEKTLKSIGKAPYWFTISGGEPFLQKHIADLAIAIDEICKPGVINIPTNSLMGEKISNDVEKILIHCPKAQIVINLSMDGVGEKHDILRGAPGNFPKIIENFKRLKKLQNKFPNLVVGIHTVISKYNVDDVPEILDFVMQLKPNQFITEIAEERVELDTVGLDITPSFEKYSKAINLVCDEIKSRKYSGLSAITESFRLEYYNFVKQWRQGKTIRMKDFAGWASCQISSWGEVWPSCIGGIPLGNLRDVNYDFKSIWFSKKSNQIRKRLKSGNESFPLANAFYSNALCNYGVFARVLLNVFKLIKI